jgi:uncharacterized protein YqeY
MSLLQAIKDKQLEARKARNANASALLSTLYSEAANVGKTDGNRESTDSEVMQTIRKFIKNVKESMSIYGDRREGDVLDRLGEELEVLQSFLPSQMNATELESVLKGIIAENGVSGPKGMGIVIRLLKERFDGQYDPRVASELAKTLLS